MKQLTVFVTLFTACFGANAQIVNDSLHPTKDTIYTGMSPTADTVPYATLYVYGVGPPDQYCVVYIDSFPVCVTVPGTFTATEIKLYRKGVSEVSVIPKKYIGVMSVISRQPLMHPKSKTINEKIDVEFGKTYYIECKPPDYAFSYYPKLQVMPAAQGQKTYQELTKDSIRYGSELIEIPKLKEPVSLCQNIQTSWDNFLHEHAEAKAKFDTISYPHHYYFSIQITIDTSGKLTVDHPDSISTETEDPDVDKQCFKVLQNLLTATQWTPAYITKKKSGRVATATKAFAYFMITSKGFQFIRIGNESITTAWKSFVYPAQLYECNLGK